MMIDTVDERRAAHLLVRLAPLLDAELRAARESAPAVGDDAAHEAALRAALATIDAVVSPRTFVYLTHRLRHGRADAARGAPAAARDVDAEARARPIPRLMCDANGARWVVSEVAPVEPADPARGGVLLFAQARARRRQPVYPSDWRTLSNEALEALLPPA